MLRSRKSSTQLDFSRADEHPGTRGCVWLLLMSAFDADNGKTGLSEHQLQFKSENRSPEERVEFAFDSSCGVNFIVPAVQPLFLVFVEGIRHRKPGINGATRVAPSREERFRLMLALEAQAKRVDHIQD